MGRQAFISVTEMFRDHAYVGKDRDEVSIAVPPGHDMKMEVVLHSGPGRNPQVKAHVKTVGAHDRFKMAMDSRTLTMRSRLSSGVRWSRPGGAAGAR